MLRIKPFRALRPPVNLCSEVASVPYDVVDRDEARALARDNPLSFLHVSRPEIDLPDQTDPYSEKVYQKASEQFISFQKSGTLIRESRPFFYVYRLRRNGRRQHGIVACCHVQDYENNIIKKHENTRIEKEEDRKRHISALRAHSGPVFLIFRDESDIDRLTGEAERNSPLYDFTAPDGVAHTVWQAPGTESMMDAFRRVPAAYIADGHHRAAAAAGIARDLVQTPGEGSKDGEANWFLAVLFPASQLEIMPYNRLARDLGGLTKEDFLNAIKARFNVSLKAPPSPIRPGQISMFLDNNWLCLTPRKTPAHDVVAALDVSILQSELLGPVLGINDPRTDKRLEFIGGIHGTAELERRVRAGRAAVAFSMYPASVNQLLSVSDAGKIMPPKSTWFEPKLRDALLIHTF